MLHYDVINIGRIRHEEMLREAEQERRAHLARGSRPSGLSLVLGRSLTHLGGWMIRWGTALQPRSISSATPG